LYLAFINRNQNPLNLAAMIVTIVHVQVKQEYIDDFIRATSVNHTLSLKEPGNLRFDVLQKQDDPARFALYEAYENETAAAAHKETPHYLAWKESVAPWMANPREGVRYNGLLPEF
jgi:autoinducer 2-degrading protein